MRHVCSALPRTAQAVSDQVRQQLRRAQAGRPAAPHRSWLPRLLSAARMACGSVRRCIKVAVTQPGRLAVCGGCWSCAPCVC